MKPHLFVLAALVGLAGCQMQSEEEQLENAIRDGLANQGTVQEVNLVQQDENNLTGYAMIREASGRTGRLNCTAQRSDGTNFSWRCAPAIDEAALQDIENAIRQNLSAQAEVAEVDMQRANDDNHMAGYVLLRDGGGNELRVPCNATRDDVQTQMFNWRCGEDQGAEANAEGTPPAADGAAQ